MNSRNPSVRNVKYKISSALRFRKLARIFFAKLTRFNFVSAAFQTVCSVCRRKFIKILRCCCQNIGNHGRYQTQEIPKFVKGQRPAETFSPLEIFHFVIPADCGHSHQAQNCLSGSRPPNNGSNWILVQQRFIVLQKVETYYMAPQEGNTRLFGGNGGIKINSFR